MLVKLRSSLATERKQMDNIDKKPKHEEAKPPVSQWLHNSRKRQFDILAASGALLLTTPIIAAAALTTFVKDRHNPFFVQERVGQNGNLFPILKLRTLGAQVHDGIGQGPQDQRATSVGRFLRTYGIDELPQLLNVLRGDMSMVGPRPITLAEVGRMRQALTPSEFAAWETAYTAGRPGIISEFAVTTRFVPPDDRDTPDHYRNRAKLDEIYAQEASPHLDTSLYKSTLALIKTLGAQAVSFQSKTSE